MSGGVRLPDKTGIGLTVTSTWMAGPLHPLAAGVMVYVTVAGSGVAFVSVWAILFPLPLANPVAIPEVSAAVQVNVAPGVVLDKAIPVVPPEQKVCEAGVAVATGKGTTVTLTLADDEQPLPSVMVTE